VNIFDSEGVFRFRWRTVRCGRVWLDQGGGRCVGARLRVRGPVLRPMIALVGGIFASEPTDVRAVRLIGEGVGRDPFATMGMIPGGSEEGCWVR